MTISVGLFLLLSVIRAGPAGLVTGARWHRWLDQELYYRSTLAFAHGDLSAARHWYPLLYSLLAVPALPILPGNPYLPLDALCFAITVSCVLRVAPVFEIGRRTALILVLATTLFYPGLQNAWLEPWTSSLSCALLWLLIARTAPLLAAGGAMVPREAAMLGGLAALIPMTRPADAVIVLVIGTWLAVQLAARRGLSARAVAAAVLGAAIPLAGYAALYLAIYGLRPTDYMRGSAQIGLSFTDLGWKATVLYLDPQPWYPESDSMLRWLPWLPLGLAGGILAAWRGPARGYAAMLLAAIAAYTLVLTAYVDLVPSGLWRYGNIHYFKWMFPLLGLLGWQFVRGARLHPRASAAVLAAIVAISCVRFDAVPAGPGEPARRADFVAPPGDWAHIYFAQSALADGNGVRRTYLGYRQLPDGGIVRAIALRRDFVGPIAWYGGGLPRVTGVVASDPDLILAGSWPAAPVRRWKSRFGWGVPCWIFSCPDRR